MKVRYMMNTDTCIYLKNRRPLAIAERLPVQPISVEIAKIYGSIRSSLKKQGNIIGGNDLWIATHALTVITNNTKEFSRVENLSIENWV